VLRKSVRGLPAVASATLLHISRLPAGYRYHPCRKSRPPGKKPY
jgi:hypothetical protein